MRKKILITGGSGFLGKNLGLYLKLKNKYNIFLCSRNIDNLKIVNKQTKCNVYPLDINNYGSVVKAFSNIQPDMIIHSAAIKYIDLAEKFPEECIQTNVIGSLNILRACKTFNIKKLIAISTDNVTNPEHNIYSLTKSLMEKSLILKSKRSKINIACVRFGNLPWSTGSIFPIWSEMSKKQKIVKSIGPDMTRYFYRVDQACSLINFMMKNINSLNGKVVVPDMKAAKIKDILDVWCKIHKVKWKKIDKRKGDKEYESIISPSEYCSFTLKNTNIGKIFLLDILNNKLKKGLNSLNAENFSTKEIKDLIQKKPKFL